MRERSRDQIAPALVFSFDWYVCLVPVLPPLFFFFFFWIRLQCPDVSEVAVVGLPDAVYGEIVAAVAVAAAATAAPERQETLTLEHLCASVRAKLADYKLPRRLKVVEKLPRNAMGKVRRGRERLVGNSQCRLF